MKLKDVDAVLEIIDDITEIRGTTYIELVERIEKLPTRAVIHDCNGCMGAAYNPRDCKTCEKVQTTGREKEMIEIVKTDHRDGWIPCSEILPEHNQTTLIQWDDGTITIGEYVLAGTWKEAHACRWPVAETPSTRIIAWMPMPEPYKEGGKR